MTKEKLKQEAEEYYFDRLDPKAIDSISEINDADTEDLIISAYLAGSEPREKRIAELEEKLKHAEENCINKTCVVFKDKEDCVAKLLELQKENAELKEKLKPENCLKSLAKNGFVKFTCVNENEHDQLTKAKEVIKNLLSAYTTYADSFDDRDNEIVEEAEQFLSEVEK